HYIVGGKVLTKSKNDIALIEIKGKLNTKKHRYTWINWGYKKECSRYNLLGFSYPKENFLRYQEGHYSRKCDIESGKKLKVRCGNNISGNGFEVIWRKGSVDRGSSGSALLSFCRLDNNEYRWIITGVLSARNRGCDPANGIYGDFFTFLKENKKARNILTQGLPDDAFEENDYLYQAFNTDEIFNNVCGEIKKLKNLALKDNDDDWFSMTLPKGCRLVLNLDYISRYGDIGLEILDDRKNILYKTKDENKNKQTFSFLARKKERIYIHLYLKDDTYQNYNLSLFKERYADAPKIDVNVKNLVPKIRYGGIQKEYYTNKPKIELLISYKSDFYNSRDLKLCVGRFLNSCRVWEPLRNPYIWNLDNKEGKYIRYVSVKTPIGRYSNFKKIVVYYDKTPPSDGKLLYSLTKEGIQFKWKDFKDNLTGIGNYKLVYGKNSNISCKKGEILYFGKNTYFLHRTKDPSGYYLICAQDKAGNWSKGTKISIK
ncbi:MAG: hypothetical protein GXO21_07980, partial [Aquificae bacterium]|nr:hypothetical protein [Aquificota bacterium]